ncbi:autotransporter assembly complex family protein [Acidocella sp.]|uniref:autotransporter assembly complex protein TamA n=1 Tax=Acidocella sp. TaxID=50710 RepID=UPI002606EF60|nr:BamA/TamA family outer membrane protein [Acidocella sp.]
MRARGAWLCAALALAGAARAADPVRYHVTFTPSGDPALDTAAMQASALATLARALPPAPVALIARAESDAALFTTLLHSQGYDQGTATLTIDGLSPADPALLPALDALPQTQTIAVKVTFHKGPAYHLGALTLAGAPPGLAFTPSLHPGQRAYAAPILAEAARLQAALRDQGYAFATVPTPQAIADPATHSLAVTYRLIPGPRVTLGAVGFTGLTRTNAAFLRRHAGLAPGAPYSAAAVEAARTRLLALGIFASLATAPLPPPDQQGRVPIIFQAGMRKRHSVTVSADYATDTGLGLGTSWLDRNLLGRAETLTLAANATGLGGTGTKAPGYDLKADFQKPDFLRQNQSLDLSLEGLRAALTAYDRTALLASAGLIRPFGAHLTLHAAAQFTSERVHQEGVTRSYVLAQLPASLVFSTVQNPLEPTGGWQASLALTPTRPMVGGHAAFLIASTGGSAYFSLTRASLIAVHAQLAGIYGASLFQVPPDQRLYAGGSGTVRGFTYQTIGPLFPDDKPKGGLSLDAFSLELRQHLTPHIGLVPFMDAGQVAAGNAPFTGHLRVSAGLGLRYYTAIGPVRLDLAFPLNRTAGSGAFALYAGLGEAF